MQHRSTRPESLVEELSTVLDAAPADTQLIATIMHTDVAETPAASDEIRKLWPGKMGAYPHTGQPGGVGGWDLSNTCDAAEFVQACTDSVERGACFVGGCCGIGPTYIRTLAECLAARQARAATGT